MRKPDVRDKPQQCYICGLPIPSVPLRPGKKQHALRTTVDHVTPLCRDGRNNRANALPVHDMCNRAKGHRLFGDMKNKERYLLHHNGKVMLAQLGVPITRRQSWAMMRSVGIEFPGPPEEWYGSCHPNVFSLDRWHDDGGAGA